MPPVCVGLMGNRRACVRNAKLYPTSWVLTSTAPTQPSLAGKFPNVIRTPTRERPSNRGMSRKAFNPGTSWKPAQATNNSSAQPPVKTSPSSSYGSSFWGDLSPSRLDVMSEGKGGKRPASQSPPGSGRRRPESPSTPPSKIPVAIPHRPTPKRTNSKSPSRKTKRVPSRPLSRRAPRSRRISRKFQKLSAPLVSE
ncbi:unnamed protein product [Clonostachys chloroleuca]|uniref:Uncharacterized protein n=1 Tax=Clonostachys chloroleuca TaxID=1926264 RepID=A0AA35Q9J9_9HYPO|nr:unnamed protein product [Clonostachys chloroleuca]